jgi:hypothetical protein
VGRASIVSDLKKRQDYMKNEHLNEELAKLLNSAPRPRYKQVTESIEYKLAMKQGDLAGAYQIAYSTIIGSGKTKSEAKRNSKKIKMEDAMNEYI